jgi:hypothetical protein
LALLSTASDDVACTYLRAGCKPDYQKYVLVDDDEEDDHGDIVVTFSTCVSMAIAMRCDKALELMMQTWSIDPYAYCAMASMAQRFRGYTPTYFAHEHGNSVALGIILKSFPFSLKYIKHLYAHCGRWKYSRDGMMTCVETHLSVVEKHVDSMNAVVWMGKRGLKDAWHDLLPNIVVPMMQTLTVNDMDGQLYSRSDRIKSKKKIKSRK